MTTANAYSLINLSLLEATFSYSPLVSCILLVVTDKKIYKAILASIASMAYSLYLGSGSAGQIEIFSANCKKLVDLGAHVDNAIVDSYNLIKKLSITQALERESYPFNGYGTSDKSADEIFSKFHPFELYLEYGWQIVPTLAFPLVAIEGGSDSFRKFSGLVRLNGLDDLIIPRQMKFIGSSRLLQHSNCFNIDPNLPNVYDIVQEKGFPQVISGAHFLSIAVFMNLFEPVISVL
jgi:hypothetical protein